MIGLSAAIAAGAFAFAPARPAPHGAAPRVSETAQFSPAQVRQMAHATPAQRKAIDRAIVASFGRLGQAGTGAMPGPDQPTLAAESWAWGITGEHIWVIMSFTDVHNGLLNAITGDCRVMLALADASDFDFMCSGLELLLAHLSNGYRPESNHGVWAALYWWPPGEIQDGYW